MELRIMSLDVERRRLGLSLRHVEQDDTPMEHHDPVEYHSFIDIDLDDNGLVQ